MSRAASRGACMSRKKDADGFRCDGLGPEDTDIEFLERCERL